MSKNSVSCIATSRDQADRIIDHLKTESFSNQDISILFPDEASTRSLEPKKEPRAPEDGVAGAESGGVISETLRWIPGMGALAIPGSGPFIAAGPIVAALSVQAVGGIARSLIGVGIPENEARRYESRVKAGNILISIHTDDAGDIARARDIFHQASAQDVCTSGQTCKPQEILATERGPRPFEISAA